MIGATESKIETAVPVSSKSQDTAMQRLPIERGSIGTFETDQQTDLSDAIRVGGRSGRFSSFALGLFFLVY